MSEYPPDVEQLLALAKDVHDPRDPDARQRVRQRVAATIAGGAAAAVASKALAHGVAKSGILSSLVTKVTVASAVVITAGTLTVSTVRQGETPKRRETTVQHARRDDSAEPAKAFAATEEVSEAEAPLVAPATERAQTKPPKRVRRRRAKTKPKASDSLRPEMAMLKRASDALTRGEPAEAHAILTQYRALFPGATLREEHDGLRVVAACMMGHPRAKASARQFLARASASVLAARVSNACDLDDP